MFQDIPYNDPIVISFVVVAFIIAFFLAFGVGANDVANFFGTVVGTNTLKLWQVFIIASIFELSGSILLGLKVSDTVRKGIANISNIPYLYPPTSDCRRPLPQPINLNPPIYSDNIGKYRTCADLINMEISIGALMGSASWLTIANLASLPVSTTHSIVGSTVGAGLVALGPKSIVWTEIGFIILSWIISPAISGCISAGLYYSLYKFVLKKENSFELCLKVVPFIYFITIFVNVFSVVHNGSHLLKFNLVPSWGAVLISLGLGAIVFVLTLFVINPYTRKKINAKINSKSLINKRSKLSDLPPSNSNTEKQLNSNSIKEIENMPPQKEIAINSNETDTAIKSETQLTSLNKPTNSLDLYVEPLPPYTTNTITPSMSPDSVDQEPNSETIEICDDARRGCKDQRTNLLFHILQVIMACFGAFVHGGNDISNSISPLMNIWLTYVDGGIINKSKPPVWILVYGSTGMIVGLVILGKRVISTIGKKITKISPASGFAIEFGSALTVLIATKLKLPISTTHCQIGSVIAVGTIRNGKKSVNFKLILNIIISWLVTLPVSGLISAATFAIAREIVYKLNMK